MDEILDCVNRSGDEFIIERKNKPIAALIPFFKLEALNKMVKGYVLEAMSNQASKVSQKEIDDLANKAKHNSRKINIY
jgi:hypothetical protein